jgi:hypothetical protein
VSEKFYLRLEQFTLAFLSVQLLTTKYLQDSTNMLLMLFECLTVDEDIIDKDYHESIEVLAEGLVHQMHEGRGRIGETKWQHEKLIMTITSAKCSLRYITRIDADLMVAGAEIDLTEILGAL